MELHLLPSVLLVSPVFNSRDVDRMLKVAASAMVSALPT